MPSFDVNWLAVVVATVAAMIIGYLWYGPVFGKIWLRGMGKTQEEIQASGSSAAIPISIVTAFITAVALASVMSAAGADTVTEGIVWGLFAAFGFIATSQMNNAVYEGRNSTVTTLYIIYQLFTLAVMGTIIAVWP